MKVIENAEQLLEDHSIPEVIVNDICTTLLQDETLSYSVINYESIKALRESDLYVEPFSDYFGGNVYICESSEDLKQIEGFDMEWAESHSNTWPNVTDKALSWDACDYVNSDRNTGWALFFACWSNAGGPVYYVPEAMWEEARLEEHMKLTNELWSD